MKLVSDGKPASQLSNISELKLKRRQLTYFNKQSLYICNIFIAQKNTNKSLLLNFAFLYKGELVPFSDLYHQTEWMRGAVSMGQTKSEFKQKMWWRVSGGPFCKYKTSLRFAIEITDCVSAVQFTTLTLTKLTLTTRSEGYVITCFTTGYLFDGGTRTDRRDVDRLLTRWTAMDANAVGSICLAYLAEVLSPTVDVFRLLLL